MAGMQYYRQIEDLAISLCVAKKITDEHWRAFLAGSVRLSNELHHYANVTMTGFVHAYPNPVQRRMTVEFLNQNKVRPVDRMGLVADSSFVRGAIVALNWVLPNAKVRSFASRDAGGCLTWLRELGQFDVQIATDAWRDATLSLRAK
jgi:hypothetical protein